MRRRRERPLDDEDITLWRHVARSVTPRPGATLPGDDLAAPKPAAPKPEQAAMQAVAHAPALKPAARPAPPPLSPFDRRTRQALKRGTQAIDAVLDLHGLHQDEAHAALRRFLVRAQDRDARLVLIVTGKGAAVATHDAPGERGVLRRVVPHWLRLPDLRGFVVGFDEAGRDHGGSGALYVRLRRRRRETGWDGS